MSYADDQINDPYAQAENDILEESLSRPHPNPREENWTKEFDEKFYKNHTTRQWMSHAGESYDSEHPQMGRAELLRFIRSLLSSAVATERGRIIEIIKQVAKVNDSNGRYNACEEILSLLTPTQESNDDNLIEERGRPDGWAD